MSLLLHDAIIIMMMKVVMCIYRVCSLYVNEYVHHLSCHVMYPWNWALMRFRD